MAKRLITIALKTLLSVLIVIGLYLLCAFTLSKISIEKKDVSNADITAYILSNGVHTDIVVPAKNDVFNWHQLVKPEYTLSQDSTAGFVAFGWGDKGFYLETPTWDDLKFSTAFKAAFGLSTSAMHVTYSQIVEEGMRCKAIKLNKEQYVKLIEYISHSFSLNKEQAAINIATKAVYGTNDAFYEAVGSYNLFRTCNTWVNNALKACDQRACFWTPFESGILNQYQ